MTLSIELRPVLNTDVNQILVTGIEGLSAGTYVQLRSGGADGYGFFSGQLTSATSIDACVGLSLDHVNGTNIYMLDGSDNVLMTGQLINRFYQATIVRAIEIESGATGDYAGLSFAVDNDTNVTLTGWDESDYNYYTAYWYRSDPSATIGDATVPSGSVHNAVTGNYGYDNLIGNLAAQDPLYGLPDGTDLWCVIVQTDDPMNPEPTGLCEVKAILQCRVRCNVAPIDITLSSTTAVTSDTATTLGLLTATDPNLTDTHTWTLTHQATAYTTGYNIPPIDYFSVANNTVIAAANTRPGTYELTFMANDGMATYTKLITVVITGAITPTDPPTPDTTSPVITLTGAASITLTVGDTWTDPGTTATDDTDATVTVTATGNVDTATPGTYTITYTATDTAGNAAIPATRTVIVQAATTPAITDFAAMASSSWSIECSFTLPVNITNNATIAWQRSTTDPESAGFDPSTDWVTIATTNISGTAITE